MKKLFLLLAIASGAFMAVGCNNAGNKTTTTEKSSVTTTDTTVHDSVSRNPDAMSEPH